jgi:hypothetical protein
MGYLPGQTVKVFEAGSGEDPRPLENSFSKRFARDLDCNRIVHYSRILQTWVYDDGTFHSDCRLEFPVEWIRRSWRPFNESAQK